MKPVRKKPFGYHGYYRHKEKMRMRYIKVPAPITHYDPITKIPLQGAESMSFQQFMSKFIIPAIGSCTTEWNAAIEIEDEILKSKDVVVLHEANWVVLKEACVKPPITGPFVRQLVPFLNAVFAAETTAPNNVKAELPATIVDGTLAVASAAS